MKNLVFMLEEPSARAMLQGLLPRLLPDEVTYRCVVFEGKQDLEKNLVRRIRGYRVPNSTFIVLRDQDSADCLVIKERLLALCRQAGKSQVLIRIACRELESWYLADLVAVENGLGLSNIAKHQGKRKYRSPDYLSSPSDELERLTNGFYQKVAGSRGIGPFLDLNNRRSNSFRFFIEGFMSELTAKEKTERQAD